MWKVVPSLMLDGMGIPWASVGRASLRQASCLSFGSGLSCAASTTKEGESSFRFYPELSCFPHPLRAEREHKGQCSFPNSWWRLNSHVHPSPTVSDVMRYSHSRYSMPFQNHALANVTEREHLAFFKSWLTCHLEFVMYLIQLWCFLQFRSDKDSSLLPLLCLGSLGCDGSFSGSHPHPPLVRIS